MTQLTVVLPDPPKPKLEEVVSSKQSTVQPLTVSKPPTQVIVTPPRSQSLTLSPIVVNTSAKKPGTQPTSSLPKPPTLVGSQPPSSDLIPPKPLREMGEKPRRRWAKKLREAGLDPSKF
jgi:hypothetical protein